MTTPVETPSEHILDARNGKVLDGAVNVTSYSTTLVHQDGSQEVMLGFSPSEHIVRVAVHKDDLPTVMKEAVGDYVIYGFCPQQHGLTMAVEPADPEGVGHLRDALSGVVNDLAAQNGETAA